MLFFSISNSFSQNPYLQNVNQQLRGIFQNITYPNTDVKFLCDRSAKLADTTFYRHNSSDTLLGLTWLQLYEEMYYASHDTTWMMTRSDIEDYFNDFYADTISIAVMDYDFYYCDNNSLLLIPNPATNNVRCHFSFAEDTDLAAEVVVLNTKGEVLYRTKTYKREVQLPIGNLQSGLYFVKVSHPSIVLVEKLIIK